MLNIISCHIHNALTAFLWCPGNVRRDYAVWGSKQRTIRLNRLSRDNVQSCSVNFPAVQGGCQIRLHNKTAACVVKNNNAILHLCNVFCANDSLRFGKQRTMQGNHIRTPKKLIKFHIIGDFSANIIWMAVICKDVHAKSLGDASCSLTNAPKPIMPIVFCASSISGESQKHQSGFVSQRP